MFGFPAMRHRRVSPHNALGRILSPILGIACCWQLCLPPKLFALPRLQSRDARSLHCVGVPRFAVEPGLLREQQQSKAYASHLLGTVSIMYGIAYCHRRVCKGTGHHMSLCRKLGISTARAAGSDRATNSFDFQQLMGILYGVAGILHLVDLFGPNTLPGIAGAPPFTELSFGGQVAALFWCATGPIAFAATRLAAKPLGDASLAFYGLYEIGLAASVPATYPSAGEQAVLNAVLVQMVVLAAYVYTAWKDQSEPVADS
mmetsp:Transcript_15533/g.24834  ORF Transcript_15533/g.24834 Transcript_15533/m.24834 type:complete len:259 (+) Transcript_15533:33-809(+)